MTTNKRAVSLAAAVVFALTMTPSAHATLTKSATFDDKVENAAAIILGHPVKQDARWDSQHRWILTYTTFHIEKSYKGLDGQQEITVVTPGGTVGDVHQETSGVPDFPRDKDAVVFIRNSSAGPTVLYFDQGAYDVVKDGHETLVTPFATDAVSIDTQRGMAVAAEAPRTLDQFASAVKDSERRTAFNRMELIKRQRHPQSTIGATFAKYKYLVILALLGIAFATWQLIRR